MAGWSRGSKSLLLVVGAGGLLVLGTCLDGASRRVIPFERGYLPLGGPLVLLYRVQLRTSGDIGVAGADSGGANQRWYRRLETGPTGPTGPAGPGASYLAYRPMIEPDAARIQDQVSRSRSLQGASDQIVDRSTSRPLLPRLGPDRPQHWTFSPAGDPLGGWPLLEPWDPGSAGDAGPDGPLPPGSPPVPPMDGISLDFYQGPPEPVTVDGRQFDCIRVDYLGARSDHGTFRSVEGSLWLCAGIGVVREERRVQLLGVPSGGIASGSPDTDGMGSDRRYELIKELIEGPQRRQASSASSPSRPGGAAGARPPSPARGSGRPVATSDPRWT